MRKCFSLNELPQCVLRPGLAITLKKGKIDGEATWFLDRTEMTADERNYDLHVFVNRYPDFKTHVIDHKLGSVQG